MTHPNQPTCLIVGAGIAGLLAATRLAAAGVRVTVLDKARGVGGRMANRRVTLPDGRVARFDHGAQYFTAKTATMQAHVAAWLAAGVIRPWATGFYAADGTPHINGEPRYIGHDGMPAVARHLAQTLDVRTGVTVAQIDAGPPFRVAAHDGTTYTADWVLLTPPAPQALALLDAGRVVLPDAARQALAQIAFDPCFAVLALLDRPSALPAPGGLWPVAREPIAWLADNQQKGVSDVPAVTIHAGPHFSRARFDDDPQKVGRDLLAEAAAYLGGAQVVDFQVQRWRYSIPTQLHPAPTLRVDVPGPLAFAGDAFAGARVEGAALSGLAAAEALLARR